MAKDVGIAVGLARQMDVDAEVGTLAHRIIQTALEQSEEKDLDNSRLFDILYS